MLPRGRAWRQDGVLALRCCPLHLDRNHIAASFREFSHRRVRPECASSSGAPGKAGCVDSDAPGAASLLAPCCRKCTPQQNGRKVKVRPLHHAAGATLRLRYFRAARPECAACVHPVDVYLRRLHARPAAAPSSRPGVVPPRAAATPPMAPMPSSDRLRALVTISLRKCRSASSNPECRQAGERLLEFRL